MENKNFTDPSENSDWLEDLLKMPQVKEDISHDQDAISGSEFRDLADMELEKILREAKQSDWLDEPVVDEPAPQITEEPAVETVPEPVAEPVAEVQPEDTSSDVPQRKVRPKRKKGYGLFGLPHLASMAIWLILAITIGVAFGRLLWVCATDVLAFGRPDKTVYVTITDSDNIGSITQKLYDAGLIQYPDLFHLYASISNAEDKISSGTFKLNTLYDYHALVGGMSANSSYRESVEVMIPEGYTCAQIFKLLEEKGVCTAAKLEQYATESEFADYWFLEGVERGHKYALEGFLFPDTYDFYLNDTPKHVFIKFLSRFEDQVDEELQDHLQTLNERLAKMMRRHGYNEAYISDHMLDLYDVITIASMIEKESAHTGENYDVSSVIYNRLTNQREFPKLQIDATLVYALGGKSGLSESDLKTDTPYNTYLYAGLPPTPISNPGLSSIMAAFSPADTLYYYYALNPSTGEHHFSKTYQEHLNFLNSLK